MAANDLSDRLESLNLTSRSPDSRASHPSNPIGDTAEDWAVPRYLFRVYSAESAGENSKEWMKSQDPGKVEQLNVFGPDAEKVAIVLNEHLRWWPTTYGDPFISWTASLLFAIQYIIYKQKTENVGLDKICLCVVDTSMFPLTTFFHDLDLIRHFQDRVAPDREIWVKEEKWGTTWACQGLEKWGKLRRRQHKSYMGIYHFGEYLSQGETHIRGASYTINSNRIVNNTLFTLVPGFESEIDPDRPARLADAVVGLREPFYCDESAAAELKLEMVLAARAIAMQFPPGFCVPVWASLFALRPFKKADVEMGKMICVRLPDQVEQFCSKKTRDILGLEQSLPEVDKAGAIMSAVRKSFAANTKTKVTRS